MRYLVEASIVVEVDVENRNEVIGVAADEIRGYKPKEFLFKFKVITQEEAERRIADLADRALNMMWDAVPEDEFVETWLGEEALAEYQGLDQIAHPVEES